MITEESIGDRGTICWKIPGESPGAPNLETLQNAKIEQVNAAAILYTVKGKGGLNLLEQEDFVSFIVTEPKVALVAPGAKVLTQKTVKAVTLETVRKHLADSHAISLEFLNKITPDDALVFHDVGDHSRLGHKHEVTNPV